MISNHVAKSLLKQPRPYQDTAPRYEVRKWLMMMQKDPWYRTQNPVTIQGIATITNSHRVNIIKRIISESDPNRKMPELVQRIYAVMRKIENREIVFCQTGINSGFMFLWLTPPHQCPYISPFSLEQEWSIFARCKTCGENKFMPVSRKPHNYALCYRCIPPSQYKPLGVTLTKKSLIREALVKMGMI